MKHVNGRRVLVTGVIAGALLAAAVMAGAQTVPGPTPAAQPVINSTTTTTTTSTTSTTSGAFDQLSSGNRKIARAIFEAQKTSTTTSIGTGTVISTSLTLDQIAAMKQSGRGWGEIYKSLQQQGLVTDKNLGQAVSSFERRHGSDGAGHVTTAGGRTHDGDDKGGASSSVGDAHGNSGRLSDTRGSGVDNRGFSSGSSSSSGGAFGHGGGRGR